MGEELRAVSANCEHGDHDDCAAMVENEHSLDRCTCPCHDLTVHPDGTASFPPGHFQRIATSLAAHPVPPVPRNGLRPHEWRPDPRSRDDQDGPCYFAGCGRDRAAHLAAASGPSAALDEDDILRSTQEASRDRAIEAVEESTARLIVAFRRWHVTRHGYPPTDEDFRAILDAATTTAGTGAEGTE